MKYFPILDSFDVYESLHQIIIIGSNSEQTVFKILKLARWTSDERDIDYSDWFLSIAEDEYTYFYDDIKKVKSTITSIISAKLVVENALGIVGFVRFKQGYYMILITKRSQVGQLGQHKIYKVDETKMIYLPGNTPSPWENVTKTDSNRYLPQTKHPDEKRYLTLFNSVDLSIDNYFSYTYDLSNTVQYNLSFYSATDECTNHIYKGIHEQQLLVNDRFVWNWSLWPPDLRPNAGRLRTGCPWLISLIHGYVGQSCISAGAGCVDIIICLIARRSRHFAGTRFMKRGSNLNGDVANEVESEQIVYENEGIEFEKSKVTSLVQLRGSIPLQWHQEIMKSIRKPPIEMTAEDAYCDVSGRHFANLIYRHGSPIIILNLVKQREKHKFEEPLSKKFVEAIDYLKCYFRNFQLENDILKYIDFDMARIQRSKYKTVLVKMAPIAEECIQKTGFFYSDDLLKQLPYNERLITKTTQCGLVRTNCIDCLDRTNTAQFVIGQAALGYQLYAMGIFNTTHIATIRSLDRMLQALYENHGNVLALQYGGSELVHNVETYRKTAKFSTQSRDFLQTISRYYNNKFSDHDKQMSINLFLGIFKPWRSLNESIWNHKNSDVFLHYNYCRSLIDHSQFSASTWLTSDIISFMPNPLVLWDKWLVLNRLYKYASDTNLLNTRKKRISSVSFYSNQDANCSDFEKVYTHLVDLLWPNLTTIVLLDPIYSQIENMNGSDVKNRPSIFYNDCDKSDGMDSVETLTSGPVMAALRNEKFNAPKSISSDSFSDMSDEDLKGSDMSKKIRLDQTNPANCSLLTNHGVDTDKHKYINFIITDYNHLSTNISDCVNSSSHFYLANDKFNMTTMKVLGNYEFNPNYCVKSMDRTLYKETVNFNMTGTMKKSNTDIHHQYFVV